MNLIVVLFTSEQFRRLNILNSDSALENGSYQSYFMLGAGCIESVKNFPNTKFLNSVCLTSNVLLPDA